MADEALAKAGLHFDELNKIRVLEPEIAQQTRELKEECKDFVESIIFTTCKFHSIFVELRQKIRTYMYLSKKLSLLFV